VPPVPGRSRQITQYSSAQIAQLKASRDKLLAELEKQFLEVDRLGVENSALLQAWNKYSRPSLAAKGAVRFSARNCILWWLVGDHQAHAHGSWLAPAHFLVSAPEHSAAAALSASNLGMDGKACTAGQLLQLLQALQEVNEAAQSWEQQAQGSLQQLDRLKDILEESASWSGGLPSRPLS
jgi:hypothetical protein